MNLINATAHTIKIFKGDTQVREILASGVIVRVEEIRENKGEIDGVPLRSRKFGNVNHLPNLQPGNSDQHGNVTSSDVEHFGMVVK